MPIAAAARGAARRARSSPSRGSAATTWPAGPTTRQAVARAAGAQAPRGQAVRADGAAAWRPRASSCTRGRRRRRCSSRASGRSCCARRRPGAAVAAAVAPRSRELGVMLPYSPLHHLLLADTGSTLVMTSGNVSDEPIAYRDDDALERLAAIADLFLLHDRPIETRTDDSVVRAVRVGGTRRPLMLRRSRGYVPASIALPVPAAQHLLACGAELKSTFCVAKGERAWVGHHIGDLAELRDAALLHGGHRALQAPVRGGAGGGRPRPAPRVPLDQVRARSWTACGSSASSTTTPTSRPVWPSTARAAPPSGRSSTAPATAATAASGAASCCSAISRASSASATCCRCGCRAARRRSASPGGWPARGSPAADDSPPERPPALADSVDPEAWRPGLGAGGERPGVAAHHERRAAVRRGRRAVRHPRGGELRGTGGDRARGRLRPGRAGGLSAAADAGSGPLVLDPRPALRALVDELARRRARRRGGGALPQHAGRRHRAGLRAARRAPRGRARRAVGRRVPEPAAARVDGPLPERAGLRVLVPERLPPNDGGIAYGQAAVAAARLAAEAAA